MLQSAIKKKTSSSSSSSSVSMMPDWSRLPEELLHIISENVEDCFDIVHARSVSNSWRSTFSFPCTLRRQSYSLPSFANFPSESKDLCTLEKIPLFLFRVQTPPPASASEYFLGGIGRDESDLTELPSPLQCSVKVKIPGSDPTLMNMRDGQVFPLGHQYRISCDSKDYRTVAFLQLNQEGREEFIVLLGFGRFFLALRSFEMKWKLVMGFRTPSSDDIVTFRSRFYVTVRDTSMTMMYTFRIDPFSLRMTPLMPMKPVGSLKYLVPCGNDDELFMVEKFLCFSNVLDFCRLTCKVSRLQEETGIWVEVSDLGDRVLFIGRFGNVSCSAKELPDGCGVSGNSILFTNELDSGTSVYKYGVDTGREEDDINCWSFSGENRVTILSTSPVVSFRVEH
ncbi:BnaC04g36680D [Brassica napus]|uniref:(rape) hypothetical protein n=1 Tax=Brassica napus TaxID=3708 RepID=A0A078G6K4_BRANA|nr:F-box/kelch-repeat protein At1g64840-like [Brassica napus]CAF1861315.1 unnamed protein product [Brassica napus]CDY20288.1 BnaC04g36680D [Brassica napus]